MAAVDFSGTWKLEKKENMEAFMDALNIAEPKRTLALSANPTVEITQNGEEFSTTYKTEAHTYEFKFKTGEKFVYKSPMHGAEVNMMATWDGSKQVLSNLDNPDGVKIIRELVGDKLVVTQSKGDVTAKRIFAKC